jgi:hypothetical protein
MLFDMKQVVKDAEEEVRKEMVKRATEALKRDLKALADAEQIVANLKRKLEDTKLAIAEGNLPKA